MFRRPVLLLAAVAAVLVVLGLLAVGMFAPGVNPQPVERVLPNERFQTR